MIKIVRLEKIKENGVDKKVIIGINYINPENQQTAYMDWQEDISKFKTFSKEEIHKYISDYLSEKQEPEGTSRLEALKQRTNRPIITRENLLMKKEFEKESFKQIQIKEIEKKPIKKIKSKEVRK